MPFNGAGVFVPIAPPDYPAVTGQLITAARFNNYTLDLMNNGLSACLPRDGQAAMTGPLPMGGFKMTGLGAPGASTDAATKGYVDLVSQGLPPAGAVGDGVTDDTAALLAAALTTAPTYLPEGKIYKYNSSIIINTDNKIFGGPGKLLPVGAIDGITVTGGCNGVILPGINMAAPLYTGTAIKVDNANRVTVRLLGVTAGSAMYIRKSNVCVIDWLWGYFPVKGITWYGDNSNRSDVLQVNFCIMDQGVGGGYGLDWDGNCDSLQCNQMGLINGMGAIIRNTSGATNPPSIGRFYNFATDFSGSHGVEVVAGQDIDFIAPYLQGSVGSGLKIGAGVNTYEVRMTAGKSRGNGRYGIENASTGPMLIAGSEDLQSNTLGEKTGNVWQRAQRLNFDDQHYIDTVLNNPIHSWDTNDYTNYDRATNTLTDFIGGTGVLIRDPARVSAGLPLRLARYSVAGLPGGAVGDTALATNGRKNGEGIGAGTGVQVFHDGANWIACDSGQPVQA